MRILYSLLFYLALPFVFLRLFWKSRKEINYRKRLSERLAIFDMPDTFKNGIWIHAVSVGEVTALLPLIQILLEKYPKKPITVTTVTPTGSAGIQKKLGDSVFHIYLPYDLPCCIKKFLKKVNPKLILIAETEIWPNILHYAHKQNIPVLGINARLSDKRFPRYLKFKRFFAPFLNYYHCICARNTVDADRFKQLGVLSEKINVAGNLKFDKILPSDTLDKGKRLREFLGVSRPVWIAASTHPGEDEIFFDAHQKVQSKLPDALLLLVPRHPGRTDDIITLCRHKHPQFNIVTRISGKPCIQETNVYIGNTIGEMMTFYAASDIAFIAGSLVPIGGHDLIEPALLALPILSGPHNMNAKQIAETFEKDNALIIAHNADIIADQVIELFQNPEKRKQLGQNAKKVVEKNRGVLERYLYPFHLIFPT